MIQQFAQLKEAILAKAKTKKKIIVAISGFGGSGKSTFAEELRQEIGDDAAVVKGDDFLLRARFGERSDDWSFIDWDRLVMQVLQPFPVADEIRYQVYDFQEDNLETWKTITGKRILLVECVGLLKPDLAKFFDLSVWIDCPLDIAAARGMKRDEDGFHGEQQEKWFELRRLWEEVWVPNDKAYFEKYHPEKQADFVYSEES